MWEFWIHSWELSQSPLLTLQREDLDRACKKKEASKYPANFELVIDSTPATAAEKGNAGAADSDGSDVDVEKEGAVSEDDEG